MKVPVWGGFNVNNPSATGYFSVNQVNQSPATDETFVKIVLPVACVAKKFYVSGVSSGTGGKSWTFTIRKNGSDTALVVSVVDNVSNGPDLTNEVSFAAGDTIDIKVVPSGTPDTSLGNFGLVLETTGQVSFVLAGSREDASGGANIGAGTSYIPILQSIFDNVANVSATEFRYYMPTSGTFKNARALLRTAPGAGESWTFTLQKNGSNTAITFTISDTGVTGSDLVNTVSVAVGDVLNWKVVGSASAASAIHTVGMEFDPDIFGENLAGCVFDSASHLAYPRQDEVSWFGMKNSGMVYDVVTGYSETRFAGVLPGPYTFKKLYCSATAPGSGKSWQLMARKNSADTSLFVNLVDANTLASNILDSFDGAAGDLVALQLTPSGTPTRPVPGSFGLVILEANASGSWFMFFGSS